MILVGPSLGSAVAIDFAVNYPEAVLLCSNLTSDIYNNLTSEEILYQETVLSSASGMI